MRNQRMNHKETIRQWAKQSRQPLRMEHDGDKAVIYIYDVIDSWFGIGAAEFVPDLAALDVSQIELHINSPGGEIFDATAIYNALRDHKAEVEARIDGIAASAASFVAQAADKIVMNRHATMMIHDAWGFTVGDAEHHRKQADILDKVSNNIAGIYADRAGGSVSEWREAMLAETWYDDQEAVDAGLADEVAGSEAVENRFDLSVYQNVPERLRRPVKKSNGRTEPTKRDAEQALREAGLSRTAAVAVVANGWDAIETPPRESADLRLLKVIKGMRQGANR